MLFRSIVGQAPCAGEIRGTLEEDQFSVRDPKSDDTVLDFKQSIGKQSIGGFRNAPGEAGSSVGSGFWRELGKLRHLSPMYWNSHYCCLYSKVSHGEYAIAMKITKV